jgi:hypothetical protein
VHKSEAGLYWRCGQLTGTSLRWQPQARELAPHGERPSVAMSNHGVVVAVFANNYGLYYTIGQVDSAGSSIAWTSPRPYDVGVSPSVAVSDDGTVYEVHASEAPAAVNDKIFQRIGRIVDDRIVWCVWPELRQRSCGFGKGIAPQVATNGNVAIEVHASSDPFDTMLYSTSSAILDRPDWLEADRDEPMDNV